MEGSVDVHFETDIIELKEQMVVNSIAQKKWIEKNKTKRLLHLGLAFTRWLFNSSRLSMLPPLILQKASLCYARYPISVSAEWDLFVKQKGTLIINSFKPWPYN